jgi:hypothetical protein
LAARYINKKILILHLWLERKKLSSAMLQVVEHIVFKTGKNKYDLKCTVLLFCSLWLSMQYGGRKERKEHRGEKGRGETGGLYLPSQPECTPTICS